jgi:hypothetical protein
MSQRVGFSKRPERRQVGRGRVPIVPLVNAKRAEIMGVAPDSQIARFNILASDRSLRSRSATEDASRSPAGEHCAASPARRSAAFHKAPPVACIGPAALDVPFPGRVEDWRRWFRRSSLSVAPRFRWECLTNRTVNWFPAPATSHVACGFPALRAPAHFTSRVMRPIRLERLPGATAERRLGTEESKRPYSHSLLRHFQSKLSLALTYESSPQVLQTDGCFYHFTPASLLDKDACAAGSLRSAGVTPLLRYYGPGRHRLVFHRFPGLAGYTMYLAPPSSRWDEDGFSSCLTCPCHRATSTTPPK